MPVMPKNGPGAASAKEVKEVVALPEGKVSYARIGAVKRQSVIDMAAIAERTSVSKAVLLNERICLGAVHKAGGQPPASLVEVAGGAGIVPGVRHMTSARETADVAGNVPGLAEIVEESLKARREMISHLYAVPTRDFYSYNSMRLMRDDMKVAALSYMVRVTVGEGSVNEEETKNH
jgi:hypothetical protein